MFSELHQPGGIAHFTKYTLHSIFPMYIQNLNVCERSFEYVHVLDVHLHSSCLVHQNFGFFGAKKFLAPMEYKHVTPNFERT